MTKIKTCLVMAVLCIGISTGYLSMLTGCKTSPEDVAYKVTGTINITAVGAMEGWLDYKNTHNVPPEQIAKVRAAWDKFTAVNQAARIAVVEFKTNKDTNSLNRAISMVTVSSTEVISLILQFLPPAEAAKLKGVK